MWVVYPIITLIMTSHPHFFIFSLVNCFNNLFITTLIITELVLLVVTWSAKGKWQRIWKYLPNPNSSFSNATHFIVQALSIWYNSFCEQTYSLDYPQTRLSQIFCGSLFIRKTDCLRITLVEQLKKKSKTTLGTNKINLTYSSHQNFVADFDELFRLLQKEKLLKKKTRILRVFS